MGEPWNTSTVKIVAPPLDHAALIIASSLIIEENEAINIVTATADAKDCKGTINLRACKYVSAVGEYDVTIKDDLVHLESPEAPTIVALANNTAVDPKFHRAYQGHFSTLGGLAYLSFARWDNYFDYYPVNHQLQNLIVGGLVQSQFVNSDVDGECQVFRDPHQEVYESLNRLAVYTGTLVNSYGTLYARKNMDPGLGINTTVTGNLHGEHNVFRTDYWYFLVAALIEGACIVVILPTYWGWWRLGRPCSFSPLEIAKVC